MVRLAKAGWHLTGALQAPVTEEYEWANRASPPFVFVFLDGGDEHLERERRRGAPLFLTCGCTGVAVLAGEEREAGYDDAAAEVQRRGRNAPRAAAGERVVDRENRIGE
jgi:hypothetical protein